MPHDKKKQQQGFLFASLSDQTDPSAVAATGEEPLWIGIGIRRAGMSYLTHPFEVSPEMKPDCDATQAI